MGCDNDYICALCENTFHRITPHETKQAKHEERIKKGSYGEADAEEHKDVAEVCEDCFQAVTRWSVAKGLPGW